MKYILSLITCLVVFSYTLKAQENTMQLELDSLFANEFKAHEPGGSVLIKKGDQTLFLKSYGLADLKTKEKITENTIFNTGSISKTFVSNGILILNERDSLSLDDNLYKYFNDFDNKALAEKITIKHMLSHTSGLPDLREVETNNDFFLTAKDKENFEPLKRAKSLVFEPGSKYEYSNPAYNGLALIIENITNKPWQQFIKDNIFKPAGMKHSKITNGSHPESGVAHAYDNYYIKGDSIYYGDYYESDYGEFSTFAAAGNGGIWCSILDLAKYEDAIRNNVFLSAETIKASRTVYKPKNWSNTSKPYIGYSWFVGKRKESGVDVVSHTGSQGGFTSFYISIPEKDILFIGLFNRPTDKFSELIKKSIELLEKNSYLEGFKKD